MKEEIVCPECYSNQITANQKGFNNAAAGIGLLTGGAMTGMILGASGSGKTIITCLKCGNKFEPGSGAVKTIDEDGSESIVLQEVIPKDPTVKILLVAFLLAILIGFVVWVNSWLQPRNEQENTTTTTIDTLQTENPKPINKKRKTHRNHKSPQNNNDNITNSNE